MRYNRKVVIISSFIIIVVVFAIITLNSIPRNNVSQGIQEVSAQKGAWEKVNLIDARNGNSFTIKDLRGKPILLETFASWCPMCKRQNDEIKKLRDEVGDSFIPIGLNVDSNEDDSIVRKYLQDNNFNWRFAVSPPHMTEALIADFGASIVNIPSSSVILICPDSTFRRLSNGLKSVDALKEEIKIGCL